MSEKTTGRTRFAVSGHVLHEAIDGEVIVIDLSSGTYYSLRDSAAEIWGVVHASPGASDGEIGAAMAVRYRANGHDVEGVVTQFLGQLEQEGLVAVVPGADATTALDPSVGPAASPREFVPPVLDKYTDMQDLVLIDPVHDVTGAGWPHAAPGAAASAG